MDSYDASGNVTNRAWRNPSGTIERTQALSWDARGRLHAVTQRDANNSGYNWTAVYDALNRRIGTTTVLVTNGVVYSASSQTINSYFDPLADFLELGVSYGIQTEWKLFGPDLSGAYGGMNGIGGLDASSPSLSLFNPIIKDVRGNVLGYYDSSAGSNTWNAARPTGYGAVPGCRPVALGSGANLEKSSAWRGLWPDVTGYYNIGLRSYDPVSGRWLACDSAWNTNDPNYYSFCGGDPINGFDSNGKCVQNAPQNLYFGVAPVMDIYLQTITYFQDGTSVSMGLPGQPSAMFVDPNQVVGNNYNWVTMQTGQWAFYTSQTPLPANFGQTISTPITQADIDFQANLQALQISTVLLGTAMTGTEEFAPSLDLPTVLTLDGDQYPVSAANLEEAGAVNTPLTVNRDAASANRSDALSGLQTVPGYDLDEAPPAFLRDPGDSYIVRPTPPADNRGSGASLGNQARGVPNGGTVVIVVKRSSD